MDFQYTADQDAFRHELREWLEANLPDDLRVDDAQDERVAPDRETFERRGAWQKKMHAAGWVGISWPREYGGRGATLMEQLIFDEECFRARAPILPGYSGIGMAGPTLIEWGTEAQKRHFIPRILSGEDIWCQGYSEPNAGSDLGNLGCKATLDGDQWVINGQKVWTSAGHLADHIFLLARTDPDAPKHKGISFLLVDMRQSGVEVRPIKMISGESEFNEVYFTDAVCPKDDVVGGVNNGWAVAMTLLGFERGEAAATVPIRFQAELDRLIALATERGVADDPIIRQRLAWCWSKVQIMRYLGMRTLTRFLAGHHPGPDGAISKLYWSEYHRVVTELAVDILGADALVPEGRAPSSAFQTDDAGAPNSSASWVMTFLNARAGTIYAGTSQIQRNILGEMVLGLPKEPKGEALSWAEQQKARG
jgi:hypothetical protein